jgi:hypothetical protein
MATVERELALLQPPVGVTPTDRKVGLGEMYAEGSQTYCLADAEAGQVALDGMLREAGWEPVSSSATADAKVWHYRKDRHLGVLTVETREQDCGRRLRVDVLEEL